jgi:hypothetical protein
MVKWKTALVGSTVLSLVLAASALSSEPQRPTIGAVSPHLHRLHDAFALGTLVRLDPSARVGEFRVRCVWRYEPHHRLRSGLRRVNLPHLSFSWDTNLSNLAGGSNPTVSRRTWARRARRHGWSGTLRLGKNDGWISNGPTTNICGGVSG